MTTNSSHKTNKKPPFPVFLSACILLFFCTLSAADSVGFVPDYIDGTAPTTSDGTMATVADASTQTNSDASGTLTATGGNTLAAATPTTPSDSTVALSSLPTLGVTNSSASTKTITVAPSGILPTRIIIPAGNINLPVQNPSTTNVDTLDNLLKAGPAHYINSADLGTAGNLIIFAHSSHLPVVINKMYQAFNNIPNLKAGDSITIVGSDGKNYLYSVISVVKASVNDGMTIDTSASHGTNLTLVTCDTLTGVSARFVLSATFIGVSN